jgi:hypothetical protein
MFKKKKDPSPQEMERRASRQAAKEDNQARRRQSHMERRESRRQSHMERRESRRISEAKKAETTRDRWREMKSVMSPPTIMLGLTASLGGFLFGADTGQISGFLIMRVRLRGTWT